MNPAQSPLRISGAVLDLGGCALDTTYGTFRLQRFRNLAEGRTALVLSIGDVESAAPLLVRVHSSCVTSEAMGACDCDCAAQLESALARIAAEGRGVVFYLMQEGRGGGLSAKARDRMIVQASRNRVTTFEAFAEMGLPADLRAYDEVAPLCELLGIRAPLRLMTNNPEKVTQLERVLEGVKLEILCRESVESPTSHFNSHYLDAKRQSGHRFERTARIEGGLPPEPIRVEPPRRLPGAESWVSIARYGIPIQLGEDVVWFVLRLIVDLEIGTEHAWLSNMRGQGVERERPNPELEWTALSLGLADRMPACAAAGRSRLFAALRALHVRGDGGVLVGFDRRNLKAEPASFREARQDRLHRCVEALAQIERDDRLRADAGR